MKAYSEKFNNRLADELKPLPENSALVEAIADYVALRDQVRACQ